jgi:hypothetical protein
MYANLLDIGGGSNTDSGAKIRVYYRDTTISYLAFIIKTFLEERTKINLRI